MKTVWAAVVAVAFCVAGCGGGLGGDGSGLPSSNTASASGSGSTAPSGNVSSTGKLAIALIDAPSTQVSSIFVTIAQVSVHSDQGWSDVFNGQLTFDLLTLKTQAAQLGIVSLPAGNVDQIRLVLDPNGPQYVVLADGTPAPLKVPSGTETGIKLIGNFDVQPCNTHTVTIDFDGEKSVSAHATGNGNGNEWILRPVVRVKAETDEAEACETSDAGTETTVDDAGTREPADDAGTSNPATPFDAGTSNVPDAGIIN